MVFTKSLKFSIEDVIPFYPRRYFVKRYEPVGIKYVGENVKKLLKIGVLSKKICPNYQSLTLSETYFCLDFLNTFGDYCFTSLKHIWYLLLKQPYGEPGVLSTNGTTNIFVVMCNDYSIYTIGVFWHQCGWSIRAYPLMVLGEKPRPWFAGNQIITELF